MLTGRKKLALTSGTPGKTQMLNVFEIDESWYIVDLPGYGYAKVSKKHRASFNKMIKEYLKRRKSLINAFVLIDSRIKPQKIDLEFINWLGKNSVPFSLVFTKVDKQKSEKTLKNISDFKKELKKDWTHLPPIFATSAVSKIGREELLEYIGNINMSLGSDEEGPTKERQ